VFGEDFMDAWKLSAALYHAQSSRQRFLRRVVLSLVVLGWSASGQAQTATTTTLTVSPSTSPLAARTAVTLTATVSAGATTLHVGQVTFCNTAGTTCPNRSILGLAQLTSAGKAVLKLVPGGGVHNYKAFFAGTPGGTTVYAASSSASQAQTVSPPSPPAPSSVVITSSGVQSNYTLTASVSGFSSVPLTGNVSFFDTTNGNLPLGTATLGASTSTAGFTYGPTSPINIGGNFPFYVGNGDFNGDGIQDLAVERANGTVTILLGNGTGGFTAASGAPLSSGATYAYIALGDFNDDGILDMALSSQSTNDVRIFLGDGTGHFSAFTGSVISTPMGTFPTGIRTGDFNGDGIADLAVANHNSNNMSILLGDGTGHFTLVSARPAVASAPYSFAVGDFNGDGKQDLAVPGSGSNNMTILLGDGTGHFSPAAGSPVAVGSNPTSAAAGDFNDDGIMDLAVANANSNNVTVLRGNGSGGFTPFPGSPVATGGNYPANIVVADFNGNGEADLATENNNSNTVTIFSGNGTGAFTPYAGSPFPTGTNPQQLTVGNFDGLGPAELAVVNGNSGDVTILLNVQTQRATATITGVSVPGHGTHNAGVTYAGNTNYITSTSGTTPLTATPIPTTLALTAAPTSSSLGQQVVLIATLSPSVVGSLQTNGETVTFRNGTTVLGTGILTSGVATLNITSLPVGTNSLTATYAGDLDFVTSTSPVLNYRVAAIGTTTTLTVTPASPVEAKTAVTLTATVVAGITAVHPGLVNFCNATAAQCSGLAVVGSAQLTGTGTAVLKFVPASGSHSYKAIFVGTTTYATSTSNTQTITVLPAGPPFLTTTAITSSGSAGNYTLTATVTGFSSTVLTGNVSFLNTTNSNALLGTAPLGASTAVPGFKNGPTSPVAVGSPASAVAVGDFNGDGILDVAALNDVDPVGSVTILIGDGSGGFTARPAIPVGAAPYAVAVGDFNGDGILDLVTANQHGNNVTILLGNGDGTFTQAPGSPVAVGGTPHSVAVGDFDGDGIADLAVANSASNTVTILRGNGSGGFTQFTGSPVAVSAGPESLAVGDFNGNGILDLVTANRGSGTVSIMLGNGSGGFSNATGSPVTVGSNPLWVAVGDFNGDGIADLATANLNDNNVSLLRGNGSGGFAPFPSSPVAVGPAPYGVAVGDFDGDGIADLAVVNHNSNNVSVLRGNGSGGFTPFAGSPVAVGSGPYPAVVGSFSGLSFAEVAVPNLGSSNISILLSSITETATATLAGVSVPGSGTHNVDAMYPASANFVASTSPTIPLTATKVATTLALTAAPTSSTYARSVVLTATLTIATTLLVPSTDGETVTFFSGGTLLGTGTLNGNVATLTTTALFAGTDNLTAVYGGDTYLLTSTSPILPFTVGKAVLTVTANNVSRLYGTANPTFTDTITGFVNGDTASVVTGAASLTTIATAFSPVGTYPISGAQGTLAATNYNFTFVNAILTVIGLPTSTTVLSVAPASVMYGNPAELKAVVAPTFATGTVSFYEGATLLGTASVDGTGTAVLPVSTLNAGAHSITATYSGDQGVPASTSTPVVLTVTQRTAVGGGPALTVAVNDATRTTTQSNPPFTYSVGGQLVNGDTYATAIMGNPVYTTAAGTQPGVFAVTVSGLTSANYTITFDPGNVTVVATGTATTLVANPASTQYGDPIILTAAVTSGATGTVTFFDGSISLGQGAVSDAGVATLMTTTLNAATHLITAVYNGDISYASSTSAPSTVAVAKKTAAGGGPALTVTVQDQSRMYGTTNPQFTYVVTGALLNGDTYASAVTGVPVYAVTDTPASPAGSTFPIDVSGLSSQNYDIAIIPGTLTIVTASTTTTLVTSATSTHYGDSMTLTATTTSANATGAVTFSEGSIVLGSGTVTNGVATFTTTALPAGTHTITASYPGDPDFGGSSSGAVTVTVAVSTGALTVTIGNATRLTGEGNPLFTYTVTGTLVNGDTYATAVTGVPVYSTTATVSSPAGTYPISIVSGLNANNYTLIFVNGTLTVNPSASTVVLTSSLNPSTYGSTVTFSATVPSDATGTVTFIDQTTSNTIGTGTIASGVATLTTSNLAAGPYHIMASYGGDTKYSPATSNALTQTVNKAVLTVTANDTTRAFATANPTFTAAIIGFVGGDTAAVVSGTASLTTTATAISPAGSYTIASAQGTLAAANYSFTFVSGTLTIVAVASSTATLTVAPASVMYGDSAVLTAVVAPSGATGTVTFYGDGTLLGTASLDGTSTATLPVSTLNVGSHNITATYNGSPSAPANTSNTVPLTVTQRTAPGGGPAITVVVNDATRTTSETNPPFSYSAGGTLVNGDSYATAIIGTPTYATAAGTAPGTFAVTVTGLTSANYSIAFVPGTLTVVISPTATTLSVNPAITQYGDTITLTANTASAATGTVSFYDGSVLLGQATVTGGVATLTTITLNATTHSITAVYNGDVTYASSTSGPATVTVGKKTALGGGPALTVTVQDASRMFETAGPQFTYVVTGTLLNGDTYASAVTGVPVYSVTDTPTSPAGSTFPINVSGLGSQNYDIAIVPGTLTIVTASTTTALATSAASTHYGDPVTLTATIAPSGATGAVTFSNGASVLGTGTVAGGAATFTTTALPAGTYTITATYVGDANFGGSTSNSVTVTVAVATGALTVTVDNTNRLTGEGNPVFTYTVIGTLVNGDTYATAVTGVPVYLTTATVGSSAGAYPISIVSGLNADNYTLTFANGTLTVGQSTTTVALTSAPNPTTYGDAVTFIATAATDATGTVTFVDQTTSTTLGTGTVTNGVATLNTNTLTAGTHQVIANYAGDMKYSAVSSIALTQMVNKAVLTVTANDATRPYDTANPTFPYTTTGFVNGDTTSVVSGTPGLTTTATLLSPVGAYPIVVAQGTMAAANYSFDFINGTLRIVVSGSSTTTLSLAPATVMYSQQTVLTATITPQGPTGTVSFYEASTLLGTVSLNGSETGVLPISSLPVGVHDLTARYNGDPNAPASTSNTVQLTVTPLTAPDGGPAITVTVNDATRTSTEANPPFTYSATGQLVNGDTYATAITGTPIYSTAAGAITGTYAITVTGLSSSNYSIAFLPGTLTIVSTPTTTTVVANPTSSQYGDPLTLTATTINGTTGTVSFYDGLVLLGQGTVSGGVATLTVTTLSATTHNIMAVYNGDLTYASSASAPAAATIGKKTGPNGEPALTVTVQNASREYGTADPEFNYIVTGTLLNGDTYDEAITGVPIYTVADSSSSPAGTTYPIDVSGLVSENYEFVVVPGTLSIVSAPTTATLAVSATSTQYGDPITLTTTIAPSGATGTVVFSEGTTVLGTGTVSGGVATLTISSLKAGPYAITSSYSGDANFGGSTTGAVAVTVSRKTGPDGSAALTITVNDASRPFGQGNPAFSYTVTGALINGDTYATAVTGVPVYSTTATIASSAGTYPVSVTGLSSSNYSSAFVNGTLTIAKATPGVAGTAPVTVGSSLNPSVTGSAITFTATVPAPATGTVTFYDGASVLGTSIIISSTATLTTSTLPPGNHSITAVYSGDANFNGVTSVALSQQVNMVATTVTIASSLNPAMFGNLVTLSSTVPAAATGTINFMDGTTSLGLIGITGGAATLSTSALAVRTHSITAVYSGDSTYSPATSSSLSQVVNKATPGVGGTPPLTVTSSLNPAPAGSPVIFSLTVPAGATGTVSFYDGTTLLGTVPIIGTTAAFTTSALSVGTHSITAVYSGDTNHNGATSTVFSQVVVSLADFAVASSTGSQLIPPGASASYNIIVSSVNAPFTNPVTMSASSLPPGATYTFSPAAVTPAAAGANTNFVVSVPKQSAALRRSRLGTAALALLVLPFAWFRRSRGRPPWLLLWLLLGLASFGAMSGCGAGGYFSQPQQTYTIMVTGTSGNLAHSTSVTLTVE
jgi:hypothetical protein